jgi:hypothetical protein
MVTHTVISETQEKEVRVIAVKSQPRQNVETSI